MQLSGVLLLDGLLRIHLERASYFSLVEVEHFLTLFIVGILPTQVAHHSPHLGLLHKFTLGMEFDYEGGTSPKNTLSLHRATHEFNQRFADRESQTSPSLVY